MEAWEQFAAALAASPAVEELVILPQALCEDDEESWDDPWMAVRGKGFAATCVLRATGVSCREIAPVDGEIICDEDWKSAKLIAPPSRARALVATWPAFRELSVSPVSGPTTEVPPLLHVRAGTEDRLAMHADAQWRVTTNTVADPAQIKRSGPEVDVTGSFDATTLAGAGSWGIVTSWYGGCGNGGTTYWNLTVLRPRGDRLVTVAERSLGSVGWSRYSSERWGWRLIPSLGTSGVVVLARAPDAAAVDRPGEPATDDVGAWRIRAGQFVRAAEP